MIEKIKNNPARVVGAVLSAAVIVASALGFHIDGTVDSIAAIASILLGTEIVRSKVTPTRKLR